jgi:tetratricopeptide (TPR) repeat protein
MRWKQLRVVALLGDSTMHMGLGDQAKGLQTAEAGLALAREIEGEQSLVRALNQVVFQMSMLRYDGVVPLAEELLELGRRQQPDLVQLTALFALAGAALSRGDRERGRALADEAFRLLDPHSMVRARPYFYFQRATLSLMQGEAERGIADLRLAEEQLRGQRTPLFEARVASELAHALRRAGRVDEALPVYQVSIRKWVDLGRRPAIANQLESFAFIARASGQPERAAHLLGAAEFIRETVHVAMTPWERDEYERELAALREALPADQLRVAWEAGRAMDLDSAVELAVKTPQAIA